MFTQVPVPRRPSVALAVGATVAIALVVLAIGATIILLVANGGSTHTGLVTRSTAATSRSEPVTP
ncbi:MAG TPA: hypothetical protein VGL37_01920 [Solirubrobacteraceae bacterium]